MSQFSSMNNQRTIIKTRHSSYNTRSLNDSGPLKADIFRSDFNIARPEGFLSTISRGSGSVQRQSYNVGISKEYYKNYEHDDVPVRDECSVSGEFHGAATATDGDRELTNSELDKLEIRIYKNLSKQLQTDKSSMQSSQCNMKLFKMTIQEIFDNFNTNMRDFDHYKIKFREIIARNKENSIYEMEAFLKEIIKQIVPTESCVTTDSDRTNPLTYSDVGTEVTDEINSTSFSEDTDPQFSTPLTVEAYKNDKYLTDTTMDRDSSVMDCGEIKQKTYNIYLLNGHPCIEINMDSRNLLSEINIRNRVVEPADQVASAENIKRVAEKKLQLKKYMKQQETPRCVEKTIPVKISYAKKNIHSEEFPEEFDENNKSFIFKICNYICRKLRKSSFG